MHITQTKVQVLDLKCVTVDSTANGKTLAELGVTVVPHVREVDLTNVGDKDIYVGSNEEAATTNSFVLVTLMSVNFRITSAAAKRLKFYCESSSRMNVRQMGD